jgi:hypothetical protein
MLLVLGQDRSQVGLVQDQGPVEDLAAQGADEALATGPPWDPELVRRFRPTRR